MTDDAWLDTVRIARDCGDVSALLPEGTSLQDAPFTIVEAITSALYFLSFEELPLEERPPKRIWLDGERLKSHFDQVQRDRKARFDPSHKEIESDGPPEENEAARDLLIG